MNENLKEKIEKDLKSTKGDTTITLTKAGISAIPIIGGSAASLFDLITTPLEKRRNYWMIEIARLLEELEKKIENFDIKKLVNNEMFITTVIHTSNIAIKNHQKEKIEALRNIIANTIVNNTEEDSRLTFLQYIDELSPTHLSLLKNLKKYVTANPDEREFIQNNINDNSEFLDELDSRGLIRNNSKNSHYGLTNKKCTINFKGIKFLNYITSPISRF